LTSAFAPTGGVIIGGIIIDKLGGYNSKTGQKSLIVFGIFAILGALAVPWLNNFYLVMFLIGMVFFFGGAIVPPLIGVIINSVGEY